MCRRSQRAGNAERRDSARGAGRRTYFESFSSAAFLNSWSAPRMNHPETTSTTRRAIPALRQVPPAANNATCPARTTARMITRAIFRFFVMQAPRKTKSPSLLCFGRARVGEGGGTFQLVPGEAPAFDGALQRLEEHHGKKLAIGEALQPHLAEQPDIFLAAGVAALEGEGDGRGNEVNHQEREI